MFVPPTMLPTDLRLSVDPPVHFPQHDPRQLATASRWSRLMSALSRSLPRRKAAVRPCQDAAASTVKPRLARPSPCTD